MVKVKAFPSFFLLFLGTFPFGLVNSFNCPYGLRFKFHPFKAIHSDQKNLENSRIFDSKIPFIFRGNSRVPIQLFGKAGDVLNEEEESIYSGGKIVLTPEQKRVRSISNSFQGTAWLSWWAQIILSTVAGVILFFAGAISDPSANMFINGTLLAGGGVILGLMSTFWTWGYATAAKKWKRPDVNLEQKKNSMLRRLRVGQFINILGMLVAIVGAEQIVGTLVAKVLSAQGLSPFLGGVSYTGQPMLLPQGAVQALDIFIVQANTNTVLSHLVGLLTSMYLRTKAQRLFQESKPDSKESKGLFATS